MQLFLVSYKDRQGLIETHLYKKSEKLSEDIAKTCNWKLLTITKKS